MKKDSREAKYIRKLGRSREESYETYRTFTETRTAEVIANIAICLIYQANYLLDRQLRHQEQLFLAKGGIRERMTRERKRRRSL